MRRLPNWPERLNAYLSAPVTFAWGEADCCLWACGGVEAMTGVDPAVPLRGLYRDQEGAMRVLRSFAGGGLLETARLLARIHDKAEVPPLQAQRGDLVVCPGPTIGGQSMAARQLDALGICVGRTAALLTPRGRRQLPLRRALTAFRI